MASKAPILTRDHLSADERRARAAGFRELDRVRVSEQVEGEDGKAVPAGSEGAIVAIWGDGATYEVEFTGPVETLASIQHGILELVERAAD